MTEPALFLFSLPVFGLTWAALWLVMSAGSEHSPARPSFRLASVAGGRTHLARRSCAPVASLASPAALAPSLPRKPR